MSEGPECGGNSRVSVAVRGSWLANEGATPLGTCVTNQPGTYEIFDTHAYIFTSARMGYGFSSKATRGCPFLRIARLLVLVMHARPSVTDY